MLQTVQVILEREDASLVVVQHRILLVQLVARDTVYHDVRSDQ